jgi:hypothetical protein
MDKEKWLETFEVTVRLQSRNKVTGDAASSECGLFELRQIQTRNLEESWIT